MLFLHLDNMEEILYQHIYGSGGGRDCLVSITTCYRLVGPGIRSWYGEILHADYNSLHTGYRVSSRGKATECLRAIPPPTVCVCIGMSRFDCYFYFTFTIRVAKMVAALSFKILIIYQITWCDIPQHILFWHVYVLPPAYFVWPWKSREPSVTLTSHRGHWPLLIRVSVSRDAFRSFSESYPSYVLRVRMCRSGWWRGRGTKIKTNVILHTRYVSACVGAGGGRGRGTKIKIK
jgi:hypothetical protein